MRWAVAVVGLAACGAAGNRPRGSSGARPAPEVLVVDAGVGRITLGVALGEDPTARLVSLVPGWTFTVERDTAEDHDVSIVTGSRDGTTGLTIVLNHFVMSQPIVSVSASDPVFQTERGVGAGLTVGDAAAAYPGLQCRLERYDPEADVLRVERRCFCTTPELVHVSFALAPAECPGAPTAAVTPLPLAGISTQRIVAVEWIPGAP